MTLILKIPQYSCAWHFGLLWLDDTMCGYKRSSTSKVSSGQTFIEIMNLFVILILKQQSIYHKALKIVTKYHQIGSPQDI